MVIKVTKMGCCFGINNAIRIFLETKKEFKNKKIVFNHELCHNMETINQLEHDKKIPILELEKIDKKIDDTVLIYSAHGHTLDEENKNNLFYSTKDALCPLLKKEYLLLEKNFANSDTTFLFYGNEKHAETKSILSRYKYLKFISKDEDLLSQLNKIEYKNNVVLFSQSTLLFVPYEEMKSYFTKMNISFSYHEICKILSDRVKDILSFKDKINEEKSIFVIVGDTKSSNANQLKELCNKTFSKSKSFLISNVEQAKKSLSYFKDKDFYIVSSTSATVENCNLIIDYLDNL